MLAHSLTVTDATDGLVTDWSNLPGEAGTLQSRYLGALNGAATETVDISPLLVQAGTSNGRDVREIESTSLGRLLQTLPIPSLLIGVHRTIVFANRAWEHISPHYAKIKHRPLHELFPHTSTSRAIASMEEQIFSTRESQSITGLLRIDGKRMWGRVHFEFVHMGKESAVLVLIGDLTAEKQQLISYQQHQAILKKEIADLEAAQAAAKESQAAMRAIIEVSPIGTAVVQENCCVYANSAFRRLFGYENGDVVLGRPIEEFIHPDSWRSLRQSLEPCRPAGPTALSVAGRGVRKGGEEFEITVWHKAHHYYGEATLMTFVADSGDAKALGSQLLQAHKPVRQEIDVEGAAGIVQKPYTVTQMSSSVRIGLRAARAEETPADTSRSPVPEKKRIDALEALLDLHGGMTSEQLMTKHGLTRRGLKSLLTKLEEVRKEFALRDADLDRLGREKNEEEQSKSLSEPEQHTTFSGNIREMDLLEIIQLMALMGCKSLLEIFSSDGRRGQVFIDRGQVKHAVCDGLQGEEAFYTCLDFTSGSFVSHPWREPAAITIGKPGDFMLMEVARRRDEARATARG